jgi:exodeoxyribonuclease VII large subunit
LLVDHLKQVLDILNDAQDTITHCAQQKLSTLNSQLSTISEAIPRLFSIVKTRQEARLDNCYQRIAHQMGLKLSTLNSQLSTIESRIPLVLERRLTSERHRMELVEEKLRALDPTLLLKRGYSITFFQGKAVRDPQDLKTGDEIETRLEKGTVVSKVKG